MIRTDPLTGALVVVNPDRQDRPSASSGSSSKGCPFCPGGLEAPEKYDVRWFENRWPAMPDGRSEVVLYSPDHKATLASLEVPGAVKVIDLWTERSAALAARDDVASVLIFENRGAEIGATISHPHGQIYAFDTVPPAMSVELGGPCAICRERPGGRLVTESDGWRAWVPDAAGWPYELLLAADAHVPDLTCVEPEGFAAILVDVLARLDRLFGRPMPYMLWIHQRPCDGREWPYAHIHVHIAPAHRAYDSMRYVAAGELGSGVLFNPVDPEQAADDLRQA